VQGVLAQPFLEEIGFRDFQREFVSQFGFPSEVIKGSNDNPPASFNKKRDQLEEGLN